jgi:hypothetical protein
LREKLKRLLLRMHAEIPSPANAVNIFGLVFRRRERFRKLIQVGINAVIDVHFLLANKVLVEPGAFEQAAAGSHLRADRLPMAFS